jgi:hypothetical protein
VSTPSCYPFCFELPSGVFSEQSTILDERYWQLLSDVLLENSSSYSTTPSYRIWLVPLLTRTPLAPIVTSLINLSVGSPIEAAERIFNASSKAIRALWAISAPKMTPETLLECFSALLGYAASNTKLDENLAGIGRLISCSLRDTLYKSSNKKKACLHAPCT